MLIGIVGKPSCGKSTFFAAATLVDVPIAAYPFTTIKPNRGVTYVRMPCPHVEFGLEGCDPKNSKCENGVRLIPIPLLDVAGLVPDAHLGRGMGNRFMDDLRTADCLIHIVDASGKTDPEGKPTNFYDPVEEIRFLEDEVAYWIAGIIKRHLQRIRGRGVGELSAILSGLKVKDDEVKEVVKELGLDEDLRWKEDDVLLFSKRLRELSKPIVIAANKIDVSGSYDNYKRMKKEFPEKWIFPCSAESELALRRAAKHGLISYIPGDEDFKILGDIPEKQKNALGFIKEKVMRRYGGTGVQRIMDFAVFKLLHLIAVYPVEDEHKLTDHFGRVLPDVFLVPEGTTVLELARMVHSDLAKHFISAIDVRTKMKVGKDHKLKNGDVMKIISAAK